MKKEKIPFDGEHSAEILLGRDTRPSGESLLEAAKQVISDLKLCNATSLPFLFDFPFFWERGQDRVFSFMYLTFVLHSIKGNQCCCWSSCP